MGKHSMAPRAHTALDTPNLSSPVLHAATVDIRPRQPEKPVTNASMMQASSLFNLRRTLMHSAVAAVASFSGVTALSAFFDGSSAAHASAALTTSLDTSSEEEASEVPAALTGSQTAQVRSVAHDIEVEAQTAPMCNVEGATGLRAAYANTDSTIFYPLMPGTYTLTSPFGMRIDPISYGYSMHTGVDWAGPVGTPIYAPADGVVESIDNDSNNGLRIRHEVNGEVFYTLYLHMYRGDILVQPGQTVSAGERIGAIGNAGYSTGPHLHFETRTSSDTPVDPVTFMRTHGAIQLTQACN